MAIDQIAQSGLSSLKVIYYSAQLFSVSLPLFTGGYNTAQLNYTRAQKELYVATYEKAVQTAFQEVADALARRGTIYALLTGHTDYVAATGRIIIWPICVIKTASTPI